MALDITLDTEGFSAQGLKDMLDKEVQKVNEALTAMEENPDDIDIQDMFSMQMLMNHLAQMSEMSTSVVNATQTAIMSSARGVKG
jgi:hypothetical protein